MSIPRRAGLIGLALFATLWLGGCATVVTAQDPLKKAPTADQSVVVIGITGNTSQVGATDSITLKRNNPADPKADETHILRQIVPGVSRDTSLFVGTLPTGEYEFVSFDFSATRQFLRFSDTMRARVGNFAVTGGKPVDLGRLVTTPLNTGLLIGRSERVTSNLELLRRFAPDYLRFFDKPGELALGWQKPRSPNDRVEEYALSSPVGADNPFELADGSVVMGARLGTALLRLPDGKWSGISSDGIEALLCVRPGDTPETHLVAVGEFGTLLRAERGSKRFVKVAPGNLPPGNLLFVAGDSQRGWVVVLQSGRDIQFLRSATLEAGQWTALRKISLESSFWSGGEQFWVWSHPKGFAYATGDSGLNFHDLSTGQWTQRSVPKGNRIIGIAADQGEHIGILTSPGGGFAGAFASQYFSRDGGANWADLKTEFKIKVAPPRRAGSGELLTMGGVFSSPELHASADDGTTWQKRSEFRLDQDLSILPGGLMLAASRGGLGIFSVRVSQDQGKTWRTEYSNFDRQAYEAQLKR
jgi:hypothetical protein